MTLQEIKAAVDAGHRVHWANPGYRVIRDKLGQYLMRYAQKLVTAVIRRQLEVA